MHIAVVESRPKTTSPGKLFQNCILRDVSRAQLSASLKRELG